MGRAKLKMFFASRPPPLTYRNPNYGKRKCINETFLKISGKMLLSKQGGLLLCQAYYLPLIILICRKNIYVCLSNYHHTGPGLRKDASNPRKFRECREQCLMMQVTLVINRHFV